MGEAMGTLRDQSSGVGVTDFPLILDEGMAWLLREHLRPGIWVEGLSRELYARVLGIREKINNVILRLLDEPDLMSVEISIGEPEAWIIDGAIAYDGTGGSGTEILLQLFRGLWALEYNLPVNLVSEPTPTAAPALD
jgi:hypothetical protein